MLGSSRTIVQDGATAPCYDADFYPFGGEHVIANACPQNYKFEGKERDAETGNDDFGARYYSSRFGRWLSADWSAVPAPVPYANLTNPQTLNLYAMVSDNPETFADLDGHGQEGSQGSSTNTGCNYTSNKCNDDQSNHDQNASQAQQQNNSQNQQNQQQTQKEDQQYHQDLQQIEQQIRDQQEAPPAGSSEYMKATLGQAGQDANQQMMVFGTTIGGMEAVGVGTVVATSATVEAAGNAAGRAYDAVQTSAAAHPQTVEKTVQAVQGAAAAATHNPLPSSARTPAGYAGYVITKVVMTIGNLR